MNILSLDVLLLDSDKKDIDPHSKKEILLNKLVSNANGKDDDLKKVHPNMNHEISLDILLPDYDKKSEKKKEKHSHLNHEILQNKLVSNSDKKEKHSHLNHELSLNKLLPNSDEKHDDTKEIHVKTDHELSLKLLPNSDEKHDDTKEIHSNMNKKNDRNKEQMLEKNDFPEALSRLPQVQKYLTFTNNECVLLHNFQKAQWLNGITATIVSQEIIPQRHLHEKILTKKLRFKIKYDQRDIDRLKNVDQSFPQTVGLDNVMKLDYSTSKNN